MKKPASFLIPFALLSAAMAHGAFLPVGDVFYLANQNGTTQFYLDNFTGLADGCSTPAGFPVCTDLSFSGSLTYSYSDNSGIVNGSFSLLAPIGPNSANGGASYAPINFIIPSTNLLSAFFTGSITPTAITTDLGPLTTDGTLTSTDLVLGGGYALLNANTADISQVPEPTSFALAIFGTLAMLLRAKRKSPRP